ncbi:MAG: cbb3-type cytochrome c oxidase subunit 3 [Sphingomonadales bacterium]|nr:cbb3-type cytochrome c oxidase subunit 3 [Sphingomonadales bacterium]
MTATQTYEGLRDFVDSWGLAAMVVLFVVLIVWPCLPRSKAANEEAANAIFKDDDHV